MPALQNTFKAELIKRYHNKYELVDVTEPTTGWQVDLERAVPQGSTPRSSFSS